MALFVGSKREEGTRSSTHLVKSGHASPATDYILDKSFKKTELKSVFKDGVLFNYRYGGAGMEDVVIPKGRIVGPCKAQKSFVSGTYKTPISLPGMSLNNSTVGVVPYNITKDWLEEDHFGGNKPAVITQDYIEIPYMPGVTPSTDYNLNGVKDEEQRISIDGKMPWGAVIGEVEVGNYVKATPSGRFTKWVKGTDCPTLIVGQVLELDKNQETHGWIKWMMYSEKHAKGDEEFVSGEGANLPTDYGFDYDANYADGRLYDYNSYQSQYTYNPTGIPGLHDGTGDYPGFGRQDTEFKDIELGKTPQTVKEGSYVYFKAKDAEGGDAKNLIAGTVEVKIDGTAVEEDRIEVSLTTGDINIKLTAADADKKVTASYRMKFFGTESFLDFKGVVGSACILLKY